MCVCVCVCVRVCVDTGVDWRRGGERSERSWIWEDKAAPPSLPTSLFVRPSVCLSVSQSVSLSVCLTV